LARLLSLTDEQVAQFHRDARSADRSVLPGAVRASANRATTLADVAALGGALRAVAATPELAGQYAVDGHGSYVPGDGSLVPAAPGC
jgi:hypothetical protein